MLPSKLRLIWLSGFRGEDLKKMANQKKEWKDFCKDCTFCNDPLTNIATVSDWPIFTNLFL
jgi:hypothetical protein